MNKIIAVAAFAAVALSAQAQAQKSLVKSFNLNGAKQVLVDVKNATIVIKQSDDEVMKVQTDVNLKNGSEALYDQLSKAGRYNLSLSAESPAATLTAAARPSIKVAGADLDEEVIITVTVPKYVDAQNINGLAYGRKKGGKAAKKATKAKKVTKKAAPKAAATK
jgi:hypothetical protein